MRHGLSFPNFGPFADPSTLVGLAVAADAAGWDGFFVWDHIVVADGVPVADPWVLLGAIAQATESIRIGPMVVALPRHRPWVVARQAVTLDHLTGGRVILGVGLGYPPDPEFTLFDDPADDRVRAGQLDEALEIITGIWSGETFEHSGVHYEVHPNRFTPRPVQQPRIPIWVAGMLPNRRPLRRAARYDGVYPIRSDMSEMTREDVAMVVSYVSEHRQGAKPFDVVVFASRGSGHESFEEAGATWLLTGPDQGGESVEHILAWVSQGPPE